VSKETSLSAGLKAAAGKAPVSIETPTQPGKATGKGSAEGGQTVLIGAHYSRQVRRALLLVQAQQENEGKTLKQLLGEAINDLCVKYRQPQPYSGEQ
jgi:hypothetical protein